MLTRAEEEIKAAHKKIARRKQGSHRRTRAKKELSRLYRKARNLHRYHRQKQNGAGSVPQRSPRRRTVEAPGL